MISLVCLFLDSISSLLLLFRSPHVLFICKIFDVKSLNLTNASYHFMNFVLQKHEQFLIFCFGLVVPLRILVH